MDDFLPLFEHSKIVIPVVVIKIPNELCTVTPVTFRL